jgi:hypothetical protein
VNAAVNACRPTAVHAYTVCRETAYSACSRAVALHAPGLVVEFEGTCSAPGFPVVGAARKAGTLVAA